MSCCTTTNNKHCGCSPSLYPMLWSKKKKKEVLEHYLECLNQKKMDIQEAIDELNSEKK